MKITVENDDGKVIRITEDAQIYDLLGVFADALAGLGYSKYEFQVKEGENE